jgi:hypothetical protein
MLRVVAGIAVVFAVALVLLLVGGGDEPALSPQDQSTPAAVAETPTPTPTVPPAGEDGNVSVRIVNGALEVEPREIERENGAVALHLENTTSDLAEIILVRGNPGSDYDTIQAAVVTGDAVQAGQRQLDRVSVEAGRYTLILRPVEPNPAVVDSVRLRVR